MCPAVKFGDNAAGCFLEHYREERMNDGSDGGGKQL